MPHASALNTWWCTIFAIWSTTTTHGLSMSCWHRKCPTGKNGRWSWSDWWCKAPERAELVIWQIYWYHHLTIPILLCFSGAIATYVKKLLFPRNFIRTNWAKKPLSENKKKTIWNYKSTSKKNYKPPKKISEPPNFFYKPPRNKKVPEEANNKRGTTTTGVQTAAPSARSCRRIFTWRIQ